MQDRDFIVYAVHKARASAAAPSRPALDAIVRFIHAAPADPNGPALTLDHWPRTGASAA